MATWVLVNSSGTVINLDTAISLQVTGSGSSWGIEYYFASDFFGPLPGVFATQADAAARIAEIVNAVPLADIT